VRSVEGVLALHDRFLEKSVTTRGHLYERQSIGHATAHAIVSVDERVDRTRFPATDIVFSRTTPAVRGPVPVVRTPPSTWSPGDAALLYLVFVRHYRSRFRQCKTDEGATGVTAIHGRVDSGRCGSSSRGKARPTNFIFVWVGLLDRFQKAGR